MFCNSAIPLLHVSLGNGHTCETRRQVLRCALWSFKQKEGRGIEKYNVIPHRGAVKISKLDVHVCISGTYLKNKVSCKSIEIDVIL